VSLAVRLGFRVFNSPITNLSPILGRVSVFPAPARVVFRFSDLGDYADYRGSPGKPAFGFLGLVGDSGDPGYPLPRYPTASQTIPDWRRVQGSCLPITGSTDHQIIRSCSLLPLPRYPTSSQTIPDWRRVQGSCLPITGSTDHQIIRSCSSLPPPGHPSLA